MPAYRPGFHAFFVTAVPYGKIEDFYFLWYHKDKELIVLPETGT